MVYFCNLCEFGRENVIYSENKINKNPEFFFKSILLKKKALAFVSVLEMYSDSCVKK